jgi:hypothetical protein
VDKPNKICVCIPAYEQVYAYFADRLAKLFLRAGKLGIDIHIKIRSAINASHILWLDGDIIFPDDLIERLLAHNVDVVAGIYPTRNTPIDSTGFYSYSHELLERAYITKNGPDLLEIEACGLGCMLVSINIFKQTQPPWFQFTPNHGEDIYFCKKIDATIYADRKISLELQHIGIKPYTHEDINV